MFRLCSTYVSTMLGLCFDCARFIFRLRSACVLNTLGLSSDCDRPTFDCARPVFWMCSTSVLTLLDLFFDCARLCLVYARHMFRLCSTCVLTVLDICFDQAPSVFRLCYHCAWPVFQFSWPKIGMSWLSRPNFVKFPFTRPDKKKFFLTLLKHNLMFWISRPKRVWHDFSTFSTDSFQKWKFWFVSTK